MKKVDYILVVSLLALCLLLLVGYGKGTVNSQTSSKPAASVPAASAPSSSVPAASVPAATTPSVKNRPVARWVTTNMVFLNTLINDSNKMSSYLENGNLAYAEIACPQLRCDIATMQGRPPPSDSLASSRALKAAPSGYKCPPIPDAQTAADLDAGMAQLETAISDLITGINKANGEQIQLAESEAKAANETFAKVLTDLKNVPSDQAASAPLTASPIETIQSFFDAVQAGDTDVVTTLTGGNQGTPIEMWCSKGLKAFVGHTTFKKWRYVIFHNDGVNAYVNVDGFMTFTDPGGFPAVRSVAHYYIDGDFKLKASGGVWTITALPGYEAPYVCDGPSSYGPDPHLFPWPGDAI